MTASTIRKTTVLITRTDLDHPDYAHRLAACTAWNALLLLDRIRLDEELEDVAAERAAHPDQEFVPADDVLDMLEEENDDLVSVEGLTVEDDPAPAPADVPEIEASAAEIRAWAARVGIPTPARGTLPRTVRAAYAEAHAGGAG